MEGTIKALAERKGCSVIFANGLYRVHLWESVYPVLEWVEEFYAREFLEHLESSRDSPMGSFVIKDCFFYRRRISICIYSNVFSSAELPTYMEVTDSQSVFCQSHINTHCSLSDRAFYEQCDSDDERYNNWWIGRLLCA